MIDRKNKTSDGKRHLFFGVPGGHTLLVINRYIQ